jgi:hypothetical protein
VLRIDGNLGVVTDHIALGGGHAAGVGIGGGNLLLLGIQLGQQLGMPVAFVLEGRDLLGEGFAGEFITGRFGGIGGREGFKVFSNAGVGVGEEFLEFAGIEVVIAPVDCAELATVNGQEFAAEQTELATDQRKLAGEGLEGF